ncbi:MAG: hypothetical protein K2G89_04545 [Lachnospiraceae bacterium]|nr:hypothetical protein [Lachnospiraceae bacterium]
MKYQRFISYLYQYRGVEKAQNTGFVKVEQKGGMFRISLRNKVTERNEQEYYIYLIEKKAGEQDRLSGVLLDKRYPAQGILVYQYIAGQEQGYSGTFSMDAFCGVLIRGYNEGSYMTLWQDMDVLPDDILCIDRDAKMENAEETAQPEVINEEGRDDTSPAEAALANNSMEFSEGGTAAQQEEISEEEINGEEENINPQAYQKGENEGPQSQRDYISGDSIFGAAYLFRNRHPLPPVEGSQLFECIRIEPRDLGLLNMQNWKYGGNSFLSHSFVRYHYLLLGKLKFQDNMEKIILGVPSIYSNRERYLANMFGFDQFVTAKRTDRKMG